MSEHGVPRQVGEDGAGEARAGAGAARDVSRDEAAACEMRPEPAPRYTVRPVMRPLASASSLPGSHDGPRAENEDDDGYDPYSDIHDGTAGPLRFERDPWR